MKHEFLNTTLWFFGIIATVVAGGAYYIDGFLFSDMAQHHGRTLLLLTYLMLCLIKVANGFDIEKSKSEGE